MAEPRDVGTSLEEASARAAGSDPVPAPGEEQERESELPSSGAFATEDFLYHLYRGSELLQDNRIGEAKDELERALAVQPRDIEGQGLLGVVYFRLGLYPRAITIYEEIVRARPHELTPKLNLGLCYLKTGQLPRAKETLEELITLKPGHARAWGYLGLVYERMGELDKAVASFERAGQPNMMRRLQRQIRDLAQPEAGPSPEVLAVREVAAEAVHELETDVRDFRSDPQHGAEPRGPSTRWHSVELGGELVPPPSRPFRPRALALTAPEPTHDAAPPEAERVESEVGSPRQLAERIQLGLARDARVERRSADVAFVRLTGPFAVRLEYVRAMSSDGGGFASAAINRRARGRDLDEPLGGMRAPMVVLTGSGALVLAASPRLVLTELTQEFLFVREDRLVGFDTTLRHESGRLATGAVEHVPVVQLSGAGLVVLRASAGLAALEVGSERSAVVRGADVLGWIGRLLPENVPAAAAPGAAPGLVAFAGEGAIFLDPH